jgi:uncharacterized protein
MTCGIAAFVKTPGVTPLKTRLGKTIGQKQAEDFYLLSCDAIKSVLKSIDSREGFSSFWAIADDSDISQNFWSSLRQLNQGEGGLGDRLSKVYGTLKNKFGIGILIGADCPQIDESIFETSLGKFSTSLKAVIGPAKDGGFYLFASNCDLSTEFWNSIKYSDSTTCDQLSKFLEIKGVEIEYLPYLSDVDTIEDLTDMIEELKCLKNILPEHNKLIDWTQKYVR